MNFSVYIDSNLNRNKCFKLLNDKYEPVNNRDNYDLSLVDYMQIVLLAIVASIGTAAVPSAGIITLTLILGSLGLGLEAIGLILAVDRILDMLRTSINVCGDAAVACVVANSEELLDKDLFNK